MSPRQWRKLLVRAWRQTQLDRAGTHAAAMAYYSVLSGAPLLLLLFSVATRLFGEEARGRIMEAVGVYAGEAGVSLIRSVMELLSNEQGALATTLGIIVIFYFSSSIFRQMKVALNAVWDADPERSVRMAVFDRLFSLFMAGFAVTGVLVALLVGVGLSALAPFFTGWLPGGAYLWYPLNTLFWFGIILVVVLLVYRYVPDTRIAWHDAFVGALVTTLLLTIGNLIIGLAISHSLRASLYGAAATIVVVLLWAFFGAYIFLYGAEFTFAYANTHGRMVRPRKRKILDKGFLRRV